MTGKQIVPLVDHRGHWTCEPMGTELIVGDDELDELSASRSGNRSLGLRALHWASSGRPVAARETQPSEPDLGPIRLDPVTPDIGRPFYRAVTTLDALALNEAPSGAEGGSNSLQRWRRRESNPRPRSHGWWRLRA